MLTRWQWILGHLTKQLWFRAGLFCIAGIASAMLALLFKGAIPDEVSRMAGADSVDTILHIIANSMLAVTIFSLNIMMAAYSTATANVTPRSTRLLLEDNTAQNALSTFIGSFLYSLVGIIVLNMGIYDSGERLVLLITTIIVIGIIIVVLLRWIDYLSQLGRVENTIAKVERATNKAIEERLKHLYLGGVPLNDYSPSASDVPVIHPDIGYIQYIDTQALGKLAKERHIEVYVQQLPGSFNDAYKPIVYASRGLNGVEIKEIREAFQVEKTRSFEQDPRFGLIVLSEIASHALSPSINDPGTAVAIIGVSVRVLSPWVVRRSTTYTVLYPGLHIPPLTTADLFDDIFTPIARDGSAIVEVGIRLQKALASLAALGDEEARRCARHHSQQALKRAEAELAIREDRDRIISLALYQ